MQELGSGRECLKSAGIDEKPQFPEEPPEKSNGQFSLAFEEAITAASAAAGGTIHTHHLLEGLTFSETHATSSFLRQHGIDWNSELFQDLRDPRPHDPHNDNRFFFTLLVATVAGMAALVAVPIYGGPRVQPWLWVITGIGVGAVVYVLLRKLWPDSKPFPEKPPYECSKCGWSSEVECAFSAEHGRCLCQPCHRREQRWGFRSTFAFYTAVAIVLVGDLAWTLAHGPAGKTHQAIIGLLWLLPFNLIAILLHEGAHLVAGQLLALRPYEFQLGQGVTVKTWHWRELLIRIRGTPNCGAVFVLRRSSTPLWRFVLFVIAGPFANLCAALLGYGVLLSTWGQGWPAGILKSWILMNAFLGLASLIPHQTEIAPSDGLNLWHAFKHPPSKLEFDEFERNAFLASKAADESDFLGALKYLDAADLLKVPGPRELATRYFYLTLARKHREAGEVAEQIEKMEFPGGFQDALLENALAWCCLQCWGDLAKGERLARAALDKTPRSPNCQGTLGAILWAQGRLDEARPYLLQALRTNPVCNSAAIDALILADLERRSGDDKLAGDYEELASRLDPNRLAHGVVEDIPTFGTGHRQSSSRCSESDPEESKVLENLDC